jgi:membrane complex biogenesis BtpA family protein
MSAERALPPKFLAAMIAVLPLPGSPLYGGDDRRVIDQALADVAVYKAAGVDSILFENDHDLPYIQPPLDEKGVALMTDIVKEARAQFDGPIGIQMLEAANITSLEIAAAADLDYIRVEAYVFAHVGGSGVINGSAGTILRRRKELAAEHIKVFADVKKKHGSHSLTIDLDITDEIRQAEFFLADGVIVTSQFTGINPDKDDLIKAKSATKLPVLIGSGMTPENITEYLPLADGFIVGSCFRNDGKFLEMLEPERLERFMKVFVPARAGIMLAEEKRNQPGLQSGPPRQSHDLRSGNVPSKRDRANDQST